MHQIVAHIPRIIFRIPGKRIHIEDIHESARITRAVLRRVPPPAHILIDAAATEHKHLVPAQMAGVVEPVDLVRAVVDQEEFERRDRQHVCVGEGFTSGCALPAVDDDAVRGVVAGDCDRCAEPKSVARDCPAGALDVPRFFADVVDVDEVQVALGGGGYRNRSAYPAMEGGGGKGDSAYNWPGVDCLVIHASIDKCATEGKQDSLRPNRDIDQRVQHEWLERGSRIRERVPTHVVRQKRVQHIDLAVGPIRKLRVRQIIEHPAGIEPESELRRERRPSRARAGDYVAGRRRELAPGSVCRLQCPQLGWPDIEVVSWAIAPDVLLGKIAPIPVGSVGLVEWSGCRLIDLLVSVDPQCAPDRARNVWVDWDNEKRVGRIAGVDRYEGFCDVDAERIHCGCQMG